MGLVNVFFYTKGIVFRISPNCFGEGHANVTETSGPIIKGNRRKKFMTVNIIYFNISEYTARVEIQSDSFGTRPKKMPLSQT
jgi:hypothetical protein